MESKAKPSLKGLFGKKHLQKKTPFNVVLEVKNDYASFILSGMQNEVEKYFFHALQLNRFSSYQVDANYAEQFKGNARIIMNIHLSAEENILKMFWYCHKICSNKNVNVVDKFLADKILPKKHLEHTENDNQTVATLWRLYAEAEKMQGMALPAYIPPLLTQQQPIKKRHKFHR